MVSVVAGGAVVHARRQGVSRGKIMNSAAWRSEESLRERRDRISGLSGLKARLSHAGADIDRGGGLPRPRACGSAAADGARRQPLARLPDRVHSLPEAKCSISPYAGALQNDRRLYEGGGGRSFWAGSGKYLDAGGREWKDLAAAPGPRHASRADRTRARRETSATEPDASGFSQATPVVSIEPGPTVAASGGSTGAGKRPPQSA